jgi:hypothetical protein
LMPDADEDGLVTDDAASPHFLVSGVEISRVGFLRLQSRTPAGLIDALVICGCRAEKAEAAQFLCDGLHLRVETPWTNISSIAENKPSPSVGSARRAHGEAASRSRGIQSSFAPCDKSAGVVAARSQAALGCATRFRTDGVVISASESAASPRARSRARSLVLGQSAL